jgi:hypothetical protein
MREIEQGAGDDDFWAANPPSIDVVIEVTDPLNRFLPFQLSLKAPQRGIYRFPGTPAELAAAIPLFSAPPRALPVHVAVVRADLYDAVNQIPAAWAVVDINANGGETAARGIADDRGQLLVALPYPTPRNFGITSPPQAGGVKLQDQTWPVTVAVSYLPGMTSTIQDLQQLLAQPPAAVWADAALTEPFVGATLAFGQELILRSWGFAGSPSAPAPLSNLLITPAGSPL